MNKKTTSVLVAFLMIFTACTGGSSREAGPQGQQGEKGDAGEVSQDLVEAAALPSLLLIFWSTILILFSARYILSNKN